MFKYIIVTGIVLAVGWVVFRWLSARRRRSQLHALVWLLESPRELTRAQIAQAVERALGRSLSHEEGDDAKADFVAGDAPLFAMVMDGSMFLVNCFASPYVDDPEEAARSVKDPRLSSAMAKHRAWLSVDLMSDDLKKDDRALDEGYRKIARIAAELFGRDCLALYNAAAGNGHLAGSELLGRMRGPDPRASLAEDSLVPVVHVGGDDPRMVAAQEEAQARWPRFVQAFESREKTQMFAVKGPFGTPPGGEFMWINVTAIEGDRVLGVLDNDPLHPANGKAGDRKIVCVSDVNDWMIRDTRNDRIEGGFTVTVLKQALKEASKEAPKDAGR